MRPRLARIVEIHGSRAALKVYLTIAIGVFTSVIIGACIALGTR